MSIEEETNFDPFEEEVTIEEEESTDEPEVVVAEPEEDTEEDQEDESTDEPKQEPEPSEEKVIPESRFKAALKDVQEKLDAALQENAKLKATPAPSRDTDPDAYEQHLRLELSKTLMREHKEDYNEVILHYQSMAKDNPSLNEMVAKHELPAKLAYDLAKRDLEIRETLELRKSDEWKEFQEFRKNKGKSNVADDLAKPTNKAANLPKNLNRATSTKPRADKQSDDDYLFADASF